jgi:hypothetical protein
MSTAASILTALLNVAPQLFALIQQELSGGPAVTDAQVQALFTAYGVEESVAVALVATLKAQGK